METVPTNTGTKAVLASIVTFEPDVDRLHQNLTAVLPQVDEVFIFDNGSSNVAEIQTLVNSMPTGSVTLERNASNIGIAAALNRSLKWAADRSAEWILTLDQDSVCQPDMVRRLKAVASSNIAMVTPYIVDRNKMTIEEYRRLALPEIQFYKHAASKGAITSGALLSVPLALKLGGFDELLFIDYVDYDLNRRILDSGYRIARLNTTFLMHEVGRARRTWLVLPRASIDGQWKWERFYSFGHSASRCYYKARNRVIYTRKYWRSTLLVNEGIWQIPQQFILILLFESERFTKLRSFIRGIRDGMRLRQIHPQRPRAQP